jgi:hypothetical protein
LDAGQSVIGLGYHAKQRQLRNHDQRSRYRTATRAVGNACRILLAGFCLGQPSVRDNSQRSKHDVYHTAKHIKNVEAVAEI